MNGPEENTQALSDRWTKEAERDFQEVVSRFVVDRAEAGKLTVEDFLTFEDRPEYTSALCRLGRAYVGQCVAAVVGMGLFREDENADLISCLERNAG